MTTECAIFTGIFEGFSWIRCEGKGSFLNSPVLKQYGDSRIANGELCLVVDLEACTGMDSTFMGTLAGMATRLSAKAQGVLQIANAGPRNQRSLEDLGLDFLMNINPTDEPWLEKLQTIRSEIKPALLTETPNQTQRTLHVLEAHQTLSATNDRNAETFANVINILESNLPQSECSPPSREPL